MGVFWGGGFWLSKFIHVAHFTHSCYSKCFTVHTCVIGGLLGLWRDCYRVSLFFIVILFLLLSVLDSY